MNISSSELCNRAHIVAVIQARMGSTRLPGKVLKPIAGKPLLWHIVHRLKRSKLIEQIAIATSTNPIDDAIVAFGNEQGIPVVRGPEANVLARFARAAELLDADVIVRVNADAPFIDAGFIDHLVSALIEQDADYVLLEDGAVTAHQGVDPFSRRGLDKLMMDAADDPVAREHVTGYFKLHPEFVRIAHARPYPSLARKAERLTIDTPDDLAFVETVHERLAAKPGDASLVDLLNLLDSEPSLRAVNSHVQQKSITAVGGVALIRCDGGGRFGYGHVKRMVAVAKNLRDHEGIGAMFAVNGTQDALRPIRAAGFEAALIEPAQEEAVLMAAIVKCAPDMLICDMREGIGRAGLERLSRHVSVTAVVDDGSERRLAANLAYYPPVSQALELAWNGSHCTPRIGWEWAPLGLPKTTPHARIASGRSTVLVTMGGSDPMGLTLQAARALSTLEPTFRARFVIGPGVSDRLQIARTIVELSPNFETLEGADGLATEFSSADVALCAFGVTAYELAAYGVPALYLCLTEDHAISATAFEHAGIGQSLGLAARATDRDIAESVQGLIADSLRRREMHMAGIRAIDGAGASRIAADLAHALAVNRVPEARQAAR